jgi:hypothetical protein
VFSATLPKWLRKRVSHSGNQRGSAKRKNGGRDWLLKFLPQELPKRAETNDHVENPNVRTECRGGGIVTGKSEYTHVKSRNYDQNQRGKVDDSHRRLDPANQ